MKISEIGADKLDTWLGGVEQYSVTLHRMGRFTQKKSHIGKIRDYVTMIKWRLIRYMEHEL